MEAGTDKRILAVHNQYLISGGEDTSHIIEKEMLENLGFEVQEYIVNNREIQKIGKIRTAFRSLWSGETYSNISHILLQKKFDFIIVQNFFPLISPSVFYAAEKHGVPVVLYLRNYRLLCPSGDFFRNNVICELCLGKSFQYPSIRYKCYRKSIFGSATIAAMNFLHKIMGTWEKKVTLYVALTEFSKKKFIEGGLPPEKIFVKPNFLNSDPGVGSHNGDFVLYVGRLTKEKGILTLLNAWKQFQGTTKLIVLGEGPLDQEVMNAQQLDARIEYKGRASTDEVYYYLQKSKFLVFPSEWYEGMPRILIEAFATGTPVICSNTGSMKSMVKHEVNGIFFKPGEVSALIEAIRKLNGDESLREKLGLQARKDYLKFYTRETNLVYFGEFLNRVLNRFKEAE